MDAEARQMFARPWAIEPGHGAAFVEVLAAAAQGRMSGLKPSVTPSAQATTPDVGGVRVLTMAGPMLHKPPAWLSEWGMEYTDTLGLAAQVQAADADPTVSAIAIRADTPGGMVGGVPELADAIAQARKPVTVAVDGILASAGVWAAAGAKQITATRSSEVGSIGVYTVRVDTSQRSANAGIKVHLISSGGVKGAGADGRVTAELLAEDARIVGQLRDEFVAAVSKGRKRDLSARATGQVWLSQDALRIGLIDSITGAGVADSTASEDSMDFSPLAALADKHPAKAHDILKMARDGKTDNEIAAALAEQVRADEIATAKAEAAAEKARADKAETDKAAALADVARLTAELQAAQAAAGRIAGLASGAATDPGPDAGPTGTITRAAFAALPPMDRAKYLRDHGIDSITA